MTRNTKVASLIKEGDELLANGNLDEAELNYRKALAQDPESAEALYSIGCICSHRRDFQAALDWAQRAVRSDPGHRQAYSLMGNALRGLNRHEESLEAFKAVPNGNSDSMVQAQMGLCCEYLGRWEDAEEHLRAALNGEPTYETRYAPIAWYSHNPVIADVHHALARVLQRQNKVEEARLHYHLVKRIDATTQLDPMYEDIMSEADLEDHPGERNYLQKTPSKEDTDEVKLKYILQLSDLKEIQGTVEAYKSEELVNFIGFVIRETQRSGMFYISAKVRAIGDLFADTKASSLFSALEKPAWKKLFELAELIDQKKMTDDEAFDLVEDMEFDWDDSDLLLKLVNRFVEIDPKTGLILALIVDKKLSKSIRKDDSGSSANLLGKAYFRSLKFERSEQELRRALGIYEGLNDVEGVLRALFYLDHLYTYQNKLNDALPVIDKYIQLSSSQKDLEHLLFGRYRRAQVLFDAKQIQECYRECLDISKISREANFSGEFCDALKILFVEAANASGNEIPKDLLEYLEASGGDESIDSILLRAEQAREKGDLEDAVEILKLAQRKAEDSGSRERLFQVLSDLGQLLYEAGSSDEAYGVLIEALGLSKSLTSAVDIWPALMCLGTLAKDKGEKEDAKKYYEHALKDARIRRHEDREIECLIQLSDASIESDEKRSHEYLDECYHKISMRSSHDEGPREWHEGLDAMREGRFKDAIVSLEKFCREDSGVDNLLPQALSFTGIAHMQLGNNTEAIARLKRASELWIKLEEPEKAVDLLGRIVGMLGQESKEYSECVDKMFNLWRGIESLSTRCTAGLRIIEVLIEAQKLQLAEQLLKEVLHIATSEEGKDLVHEMEARNYQGWIDRQTGRYKEAIEQYRYALETAQYLKNDRFEGIIRGNLGISLRYLGLLDDAVEQYNRAIEIADLYGDFEAVARHRMNLASAFFILGEKSKGTSAASSALEYFESSRNEELASRVLILIESENPQNIPQEINSRLKKLEKAGLHSRDYIIRAWSQTRKAQSLADKGKIKKAISIMEEVVSTYDSIGDRFNQASAILGLAEIAAVNDLDQAIKSATIALDIAQEIGSTGLAAKSSQFLLELSLIKGEEDQIICNLNSLRQLWTRMRRNLRNDDDRVNHADNVARTIKLLASHFLKLEQYTLAFELLEYGRAQALADMIVLDMARCEKAGDSAVRVLLEKEAEILKSMRSRGCLSDKMDIIGAIRSEEKAICSPEEELDDIYNKLMAHDPFYVMQKKCIPVDLSRAQALLGTFNQPAILLTFDLLDDEVIIMSLRSHQNSISLYRTGVTSSQIEELLRLTVEDFKDKEGARLWFDKASQLLSEACAEIQMDDLVIMIPSGDLQQLPLHAVRLPSGEFLIERAAVIYTPSLTILEALQLSPRQSKESIIDLKTVGVNFQNEARAIVQFRLSGTCLSGNYIPKAQLREFLSDCRMVHFSCHGFYDPDHYMNSGLILRNTDTPMLDDILSLRDLIDWRLEKDLVVLSACETGLGKSHPSEFLGLSRGFLGAGARALVVTLWSIDDASTQDFMLKFYDDLEKQLEEGIEDFASALRRTQCKFIKKEDPIKSFYDWAGFKLLGQPRIALRRFEFAG